MILRDFGNGEKGSGILGGNHLGGLLATSELLGMPPRCKGKQIHLRTAPFGFLKKFVSSRKWVFVFKKTFLKIFFFLKKPKRGLAKVDLFSFAPGRHTQQFRGGKQPP